MTHFPVLTKEGLDSEQKSLWDELTTLAEGAREDVVRIIGYRGLVQLVAAVTLYVVTAHTTNVGRVRLAEDFSADPEKLKDFFAGKPVSDDRG